MKHQILFSFLCVDFVFMDDDGVVNPKEKKLILVDEYE